MQTQGGMTEQEHTWLDTTQQAVQQVFTDLTGVAFSNPIGSLIAHPDMAFLQVCDEAFPISGRGELTRPAPGVGVNAYGLALFVDQVPPGFGTRDGVVISYFERIAQLLTLHQRKATTDEWVTEELQLRLATYLWLWRTPSPHRIVYDVTPGCVVGAQWICAAL
jgi:hypothetical protein